MFGLRITKSDRISILIFTILGTIFTLSGLFRVFLGPAQITIRNTSPHTLTEVKASGHRFSREIAELKPAESVSFITYADGESGVQMEFFANGNRRSTEELGYFEGTGGHCVTVVIDPLLNVIVDTSSPLCFSWRRVI